MGHTVVVLAAGEGKRMKSGLPKVLHPLLGRTLLGHVLTAVEPLGAERVVVVVGHGADQVREHLAQIAPQAVPVLQAQQLGTGHAVRVALEAVPEADGDILVLNGDLPLVTAQTLSRLVDLRARSGASATLLTAEVADPYGLGRIVRDDDGDFTSIVEERDANAEQRLITEINAGAYAFQGSALRAALSKLHSGNDQGEEYLTDVFELLVGVGHPVATVLTPDADEALGANDRAQLAVLRALLRDRINGDWMRAGATLLDPATTWIDVTVQLARDVVVEPNVQLRGATVVDEGAIVGPDSTLTDVRIGAGASVVRTHGSQAVIAPGATVGPYAYLRPGTELGERGKIGTFVETKNAQIGAGSKVPHLSYVGDATIGEHTNIGAASVFVNYDGVAKHRTVIGSHARTGSDNMFVAPVEVGDGAYTGAGTIVRRDVPPGAMSYSAAPQRVVEGWVELRRAGTAAAEAAASALAAGTGPPETGGTDPAGDDAPQPAATSAAPDTAADGGAG